MTGLLEKFEAMKRLHPHGNVEDLIETSVMSLEGTLPTITEAQIERERESLRRLEKALGLYEIASFLLDTAGPEAVGTALKRIEEQKEQEPTLAWAMANPHKYQEKEEDMDNDELVNAIEEAVDNGDDDTLEDLLEKIKARRKIRLGVNRTKISDNRLRSNKPVRDFNTLINKPINDFNRLAGLHREGEQLTDEEFEALAGNVLNEDDSDNILNENAAFRIRQIMVQKAAEKRNKQNAEKNRTDFLRNRLANESTAAQDSIKAHEFEPDETPLSAFLPSEFAPKIEKTADDRSFVAMAGRMKSNPKSAATIARPVASNAGFKSNVDNDHGDKPFNQTSAAAAEVASRMSGEETYRKHPTSQGQTKMDPKTLTATLPPNGR